MKASKIMLTSVNVQMLSAFFALNDHELTRGYIYITEEAITRRLDSIDPSWQFERLEVSRRDDRIVATGRLTVCGVSRDGIGMQKIDDFGEAEKGAITDALKRCARLFGVGRYILDASGTYKDLADFGKWLTAQQKNAPSVVIPTQATPAPQQAANPFSAPATVTPDPAPKPLETAHNAKNGYKPEDAQAEVLIEESIDARDAVLAQFLELPIAKAWGDVRKWLLVHVYDNKIHMDKSIEKWGKETNNWKGMTAGEVMSYLANRHKQDAELPKASGQ